MLCGDPRPASAPVVVLGRESDGQPWKAGEASTPLRILLVDDHEFNRRVGIRKLEGWGHKVVTASSGGEALALLEQQHFDLALIDIQMADIDGLEVTAAVRRGRGRDRPAPADHRHDGPGDEGRPGGLPGRGHGRPCHEADPRPGTLAGDPECHARGRPDAQPMPMPRPPGRPTTLLTGPR